MDSEWHAGRIPGEEVRRQAQVDGDRGRDNALPLQRLRIIDQFAELHRAIAGQPARCIVWHAALVTDLLNRCRTATECNIPEYDTLHRLAQLRLVFTLKDQELD